MEEKNHKKRKERKKAIFKKWFPYHFENGSENWKSWMQSKQLSSKSVNIIHAIYLCIDSAKASLLDGWREAKTKKTELKFIFK